MPSQDYLHGLDDAERARIWEREKSSVIEKRKERRRKEEKMRERLTSRKHVGKLSIKTWREKRETPTECRD